jgi:hypothetical protein
VWSHFPRPRPGVIPSVSPLIQTLGLMKYVLALIAISLALLAYANSMPAYHDSPNGKYWADVPDRDSGKYHEARAAALTNKYKIQDWGCTLLIYAIVYGIYIRFKGIPAPTSKIGMLVAALAGPALTALSMILDLSQGLQRGEFPPWADSIGIPLMGVPPIFAISLAWSLGHLVLVAGARKSTRQRLSIRAVRSGNKWLLAVSSITALLLIAVSAEASYLFVVPGVAWLYFYTSIAAVRYEA